MDVRTATDTVGWKLGGGSVGVDSVFNIALIVCVCIGFCHCFVMHYFSSLSSFSMTLIRKKESQLIFFNCLPDIL